MKKIILLLIILVGIIVVPISTSNFRGLLYGPILKSITDDNLSESEIDKGKKWEYIKARLFPLGGNIVSKFKGPILISLENPSKAQEVLVSESINEINELLHNKTISLYKDYTGYDHQYIISSVADSSSNNELFYLYTRSISISFGEKPSPNTDYIEPSRYVYPKLTTSVLSDSTVIKRSSSTIRLREEIKGGIICFNFSERSNSKQQKKYIKYELLRSICNISKEDLYKNDRFFQGLSNIRYLLVSDKGLYSNSKYNPENYEITEYDKFLLKKLYTDDFQSEFKNHLIKYYPKLYVYNFYHRARVKILSKILIIIIGAFIFMMSLSILHKKRFRFGLLNYLIPILLVNVSLFSLLNIKNYIQIDYTFISLRIFEYSFLLLILLVSLFQAISLWLVEYLFTNKLKSFVLKLILKVILTFICFAVLLLFLNIYTRIYSEIILLLSIIVSISRGLYIYLNHYSESITRKKDLEISQLKELQAAAELNSLHAQINPHFLYNSLNSIAGLAHNNPEKTEKMALSLSDLFKYSINRKGRKMSTVEEEVEMVENYLQIEKIRFEDRLQFSLDIDNTVLQTPLPRFLLQPLVENAIKHGIAKIEEKGCIHLQISKINISLIISVSDTGPDFPDGLLSGHGLQSVYDLLRLSYGEQASINWENLPKKKITIIINSHS